MSEQPVKGRHVACHRRRQCRIDHMVARDVDRIDPVHRLGPCRLGDGLVAHPCQIAIQPDIEAHGIIKQRTHRCHVAAHKDGHCPKQICIVHPLPFSRRQKIVGKVQIAGQFLEQAKLGPHPLQPERLVVGGERIDLIRQLANGVFAVIRVHQIDQRLGKA